MNLQQLAEAVVSSADDTGCSGDLIVVSKSAVEKLAQVLQAKDWWAVTCRRNGDDEDSIYFVQADDFEEAGRLAEDQLRDDCDMGPRPDDDEEENENNLVYINHTVNIGKQQPKED